MIEAYVIPAVIFAIGIFSLTTGRRKARTTLWFTLLLSAVIIFNQKGPLEMILFISLFIPIVYIANLKDERNKKSRHSSIQEKATAYLALLPTFGFYFLFKDKIEENLGQQFLELPLMHNFEVLLVLLSGLAIYSFFKNRSHL